MLLQHTTLLFVGIKCILPPQICLAFTTFTTIYFPLLWFNGHLYLLTIFHSLFYLLTSLINRALLLTFHLWIHPNTLPFCFIAQLWNNFFFSYSELKYWLSLSFLCLFHCYALHFFQCHTSWPQTPLLRLAFHNHRNRWKQITVATGE